MYLLFNRWQGKTDPHSYAEMLFSNDKSVEMNVLYVVLRESIRYLWNLHRSLRIKKDGNEAGRSYEDEWKPRKKILNWEMDEWHDCSCFDIKVDNNLRDNGFMRDLSSLKIGCTLVTAKNGEKVKEKKARRNLIVSFALTILWCKWSYEILRIVVVM